MRRRPRRCWRRRWSSSRRGSTASTSSTSTRRKASSNGRSSRGSPCSWSRWKSADESIADVTLGRLCRCAQVEAIDAVRDAARRRERARDRLLRRRHHARRDAGLSRGARARRTRSQSATFFTAQVDFSEAGDLKLFVGDEQMELIDAAHRRQGLSRRPLHGRDLQPAARPRPDLELRRQQLPAGRGLSAVRPAPLERRHHQPAGRVAPRLSRASSTARTSWSSRAASASTARRSTSAR